VFSGIPREFSRESSVTVWDIAAGHRAFDIGDKEFPILRFCLSPNGCFLYSCGDKVLSWDATKSGPPIQEFDASGRRMISVAVSPDGTMLAAGGLDGTVVIWQIGSSTRLATLMHQGGPVYGLAFAPTSKKLVAAGERGVATIWDLEIHSRKRD
jgi:WD40 repeat protein